MDQANRRPYGLFGVRDILVKGLDVYNLDLKGYFFQFICRFGFQMDTKRSQYCLMYSFSDFYKKYLCTFSVSPELLQGFARGLARVGFLRNITLLVINMKATW